jgi:hypothetical protein
MIALCGEHHDKADAGAYKKQQLREFKRKGAARAGEVRGRFDWMRNELLAVVGGSFYYETPIIFQYRDDPSIWFNRDDDGYLLLNIRMLSTAREPRIRVEDNFWVSKGDPEDLESPPSGKRLYVKYPNNDMLRIEYFELDSAEETQKRYPEGQLEKRLKELKDDPFPITAVEVHNRVGGTQIEFTPRETRMIGATIRNGFFAYNAVGIALN